MSRVFVSLLHMDILKSQVQVADAFLFHSIDDALHRGCLLGCGCLPCDERGLTSAAALSQQGVHGGKASTKWEFNIGHFVLPGYGQDAVNAF